MGVVSGRAADAADVVPQDGADDPLAVRRAKEMRGEDLEDKSRHA